MTENGEIILRILCYGDSNTWGYNPVDASRYQNRWTKVLADLLPEDEIIEEGLSGRNINREDPDIPNRNGFPVLPVLIRTHRPLDLVIIMLGSNDLKKFHHITKEILADDLKKTIDVINDEELEFPYPVPEILVMAPVELGDGILTTSKWKDYFDENSIKVSKELAEAYREVAERENTYFFDASEVAEASEYDSLHLDETEHRKLAEALCVEIKGIKAK